MLFPESGVKLDFELLHFGSNLVEFVIDFVDCNLCLLNRIRKELLDLGHGQLYEAVADFVSEEYR